MVENEVMLSLGLNIGTKFDNLLQPQEPISLVPIETALRGGLLCGVRWEGELQLR